MADAGTIGSGHISVNRNINTVVRSIAVGQDYMLVGRNTLPTSDFPDVNIRYRNTPARSLNVSPLSAFKGSGHISAGRNNLVTSDFPIVNGKERNTDLHSKNIPVWSNRGSNNYTNIIPQVYAKDTPGIISGTLQTSVIIDYNHIVRLYYRPNGYLIDQVRTKIDGSFTFTKNIDKAEVGNYYIIAFDLNNNFNAFIYDLLTPE